MRTTRLWAAILVAAAIIVTAIVTPAGVEAADDVDRATLTLVRTTDGPASFNLTTSVVPGDRGGFTGFVGARVDRGQISAVVPGSQLSHGRTDDPTIFTGDDKPVTVCSLGGPCEISKAFLGFLGVAWSDDGGSDVVNRVFVVLEGEEIDFKLEARGWKLVQDDYGYRYVDGQDSDAVGVSYATHGVEMLLRASAPGGPRTSIAQAVPPCSQFGLGGVAARGVGEMTLDGGVTKPAPRLECPQSTQPLVDHARAGTTWEAHGRVVGQSDLAQTHLFVIEPPLGDAPAAPPGPRPDPPDDAPPPTREAPPSAPPRVVNAPAPSRGDAAGPVSPAVTPSSSSCRPAIQARRRGKTIRIRARSESTCRLRYRLSARGRVLATARTLTRSGRATTTTLRLRRAARGPYRLVVQATDVRGAGAATRSLTVR